MTERERDLPGNKDGQPQPGEVLRRDNLLWVNPTELLHDNPAAQIVNREAYKRIAARFSSDQFDPPQVVRVRTYTPAGEVIRTFVVDGMTRTKYASDHQAESAPDDPNFKFNLIPVRDVTRSLLQNPEVVLAEEREEEGQGVEAITMLQYLRAVIPPTIEHSEIASDRIAAHLINGWENMVGADVANRFSATAALKVLTNDKIYRATERDLQKELSNQRALFAGESIGQRARVQQALLEMASIIRQTKRFPQEIARAAFFLVGTTSPVIGEEAGTRREIYGLLHLPAVEEKLATFEQIGEREQMRMQLGQVMLEALQKSPGKDSDRVFSTLHESLVDTNLSFDDVLNVMTSVNPVEQYDTVRKDVHRDRLAKFYQSSSGREELTEFEEVLINRLGRKTILEGRLETQTSAIKEGNKSLERASILATEFSTKRQELIDQGVTIALIDEALRDISKAQTDLLQADNLRDVNTKLRNLVGIIDETERRVSTQRKVHQIGQLTDAVFGEELRAEHGSWLRDSAVNWLAYAEFRDATFNPVTARRFLQQLQSLGMPLRAEIFRGGMMLQAAVRRQEEIRASRLRVEQVRVEQVRVEQVVPVLTTSERPEAVPAPAQSVEAITGGVTAKEQAERPTQAQAAEERRLNNEQFRALMKAWVRDLLGVTDIRAIEPDKDMTADLDTILGVIGWPRFPQNPHIVRVMETDYPRLQRDITSLRESLHDRDNRDILRGTQTGR